MIDAHGALPVVGDGVDIELMGADDETAERVLRAESWPSSTMSGNRAAPDGFRCAGCSEEEEQ